MYHQWQSFWRRRNAGQGVVVMILTGVIVLYLLSLAVFIGISLPVLLRRAVQGQDIIEVFCGFILYYFSLDILLRFMFQDLPTLTIQPYLVQNIRRGQLTRFLNIRSLFSFFNLAPLLIFIPFSVSVIRASYGWTAAGVFLTSILFLTIFNHFSVLYIKRKTIINSWWIVVFLGVAALAATGDYFNVFSIRNVSARVFTAFLHNAWLCMTPVGMGVAAFLNNNRFLQKNMYIEEMVKSSDKKQSAEYTWLQRFGEAGDLMAMDLKMILRNKRTRYVLFISVMILLYGFMFYKPEYIQNDRFGSLLIAAILITGTFILNYGNFLFSWQSSHFDGLMAGNIQVRVYIKSKFMLFVTVSTLSLIVGSLYGLISWKIIPVQIAAYFYNAGINTVIATWFATYNYRAIDLDQAATFNYQGVGATKWLYVVVMLSLPFALYALLAWLFNPWAGIIVLGSAGLISFLLQEWWIGILTKGFLQRKHLILEGFRQK